MKCCRCKADAVDGLSMCSRCYILCRDYRRRYELKHKEKRLARVLKTRADRVSCGLCPNCGKVKDSHTYKCSICHENSLESAVRRNR